MVATGAGAPASCRSFPTSTDVGAVIFTSLRNDGEKGHGAMATRMEALAAQQPGFLGIKSSRDGVGITVSYWRVLRAGRSAVKTGRNAGRHA